jgi:hypothetical protein
VSFLADTNVDVFISLTKLPLVPDAFSSMNITSPETFDYTEVRAYFVWGVVFDPFDILRGERPQIYMLIGAGYKPFNDVWTEDIGLGAAPLERRIQ